MIQLTAIVDGKPCTLLTPYGVAEAERGCRDRFGDRFDGFAPISAQVRADSAWSEYRAGRMTREELEAWLSDQGEDEGQIRAIFNDKMKKRAR